MNSRLIAHLLPAAGFLLATLATSGSSTALAQGRASATGFQFPTNPAAWVNSQPFTREQLGGKVAVMVFFEEG
jgi:cytochrome oxidase Cu insertion factor (SCO1/SenC/PrrC family)